MSASVFGDLPDVLSGVSGDLYELGLGDAGRSGGADRVVDGGQSLVGAGLGAAVVSEGAGDDVGFGGHVGTVANELCQVDLTAKSGMHSLVGMNNETSTEYALMIDWGKDGTEYVPATSFEHAERMAETIYAGHPSWTVGRERQPWRYVRRADAVLTDEVAS